MASLGPFQSCFSVTWGFFFQSWGKFWVKLKCRWKNTIFSSYIYPSSKDLPPSPQKLVCVYEEGKLVLFLDYNHFALILASQCSSCCTVIKAVEGVSWFNSSLSLSPVVFRIISLFNCLDVPFIKPFLRAISLFASCSGLSPLISQAWRFFSCFHNCRSTPRDLFSNAARVSA